MTTLEPLNKWYASLKRYKDGFPARGTLAGALAALTTLATGSAAGAASLRLAVQSLVLPSFPI